MHEIKIMKSLQLQGQSLGYNNGRKELREEDKSIWEKVKVPRGCFGRTIYVSIAVTKKSEHIVLERRLVNQE